MIFSNYWVSDPSLSSVSGFSNDDMQKWIGAAKDPFQSEESIKQLVAPPQLIKKEVDDYIDYKIQSCKVKAAAKPNQVDGFAALSEMVAWNQRKVERLVADKDDAVNQKFMAEFIAFLLGKTDPNSAEYAIIKETNNWKIDEQPPIRRNSAHDVRAYINTYLDRHFAMIDKTLRLKLEGPSSLNEHWLFFKYIVKGHIKDYGTRPYPEIFLDYDDWLDPKANYGMFSEPMKDRLNMGLDVTPAQGFAGYGKFINSADSSETQTERNASITGHNHPNETVSVDNSITTTPPTIQEKLSEHKMTQAEAQEQVLKEFEERMTRINQEWLEESNQEKEDEGKGLTDRQRDAFDTLKDDTITDNFIVKHVNKLTKITDEKMNEIEQEYAALITIFGDYKDNNFNKDEDDKSKINQSIVNAARVLESYHEKKAKIEESEKKASDIVKKYITRRKSKQSSPPVSDPIPTPADNNVFADDDNPQELDKAEEETRKFVVELGNEMLTYNGEDQEKGSKWRQEINDLQNKLIDIEGRYIEGAVPEWVTYHLKELSLLQEQIRERREEAEKRKVTTTTTTATLVPIQKQTK